MSAPVARANRLDLRASAASHAEPAASAVHEPVKKSSHRRRFSLPKVPLHPVSIGILGGLVAAITIGVIVPLLPAKEISTVAQSAPSVTPVAAAAAAPAATRKPAAPTDRLSINRLGTNAPVIQVGLTSEGAIDTPKTLWQVGHYKGSAVVGATSSAVIVGHSGAPGQIGVFEHIDRIQPGDLITYTRADGTAFTFRATSSKAYPVNKDTARTLSAPTTGPSLNLISCYGHWDKSTEKYDQRWIVKAELVK